MTTRSGLPRETLFAPREFRRRLSAVRSEMRGRDLDALMIFSAPNIYYLTGHHSIDSWEFRVAIITHDRETVLMLYGFERGRFLASSWLKDAIFYGPQDDPVDRMARVLGDMGLGKARIGIESSASNLNVQTSRNMEKRLKFATLVVTDRLVDRIRMIKSRAELACIRRAAAMTHLGVRAGIAAIHEGVTDNEIMAVISNALFRAGSHQLVMQPTVAIGRRSGLAHSQHNGVRARRGDSVFLELSGNWRHYSAPLMHTTVIGRADDERKELLAVAHRVADVIVENARPGVRACDVAARARAAMRTIEERVQFHYIFGYSVGISFPPHWLEGSNFHIRATNPEPLREGMVFHLPLTMRVLGKYGAGTSRTIEITARGARVLTGDPSDLKLRS